MTHPGLERRWAIPNMIPDSVGGILHDYSSAAWGAQFADPRVMEPLWDGIDVFGFLPLFFWNSPDPILTNLIPQIMAHGKKIAALGGAIGDNSVLGAAAATNELVQINWIYARGGKLDYLTLDGAPIQMMMPPLSYNSTTAIPQVVAYMQTIHAAHPDIKIGLDVNMPGWQFQGGPAFFDFPGLVVEDYATVLTNLVAAVNAAGEKLWYVHLDGGYELFDQDWSVSIPAPRHIDAMKRWLALQDLAHSLGLDFGLYVSAQSLTPPDDRDWATRCQKYINDWITVGGKADQIALISFEQTPTALLPATTPYTFFHTYERVQAAVTIPTPLLTTGSLVVGRPAPKFKLSFFGAVNAGTVGAASISLDLNPDVEAIDFTTDVYTGFQALTVGYDKTERFANEGRDRHFGRLQQPVDIAGFNHVNLTEGKDLVWEGRIMLPEFIGGMVRAFQAQGYGDTGMLDGVWESQSKAPMTSGRLLAQVIRTCAPTLIISPNSENYVDPQVFLVPTNFSFQTPAAIKNAVLQAGDGNGDQLLFTVYEGRFVQLGVLVPPAVAHYSFDFSERIALQQKFDDAYSDLIFTYEGGSLSPIRKSNQSWRYNVRRTQHIDGGKMDDAHALAYVQTWLAKAASPTISAPIIVGGKAYGDVEGVPLVYGGTKAPWLVRAGEWIQLGVQDNGQPSLYPIVRTSFSLNTLQLTLEVGAPMLGMDQRNRELQVATRQLAAGVNVFTGAVA